VTKHLFGRSGGDVTKIATALLVFAAAVAAGCGDGGETITTQEPAGGPLVVYEREGGVAFTAQRMVIEEDGAATVEVAGPGDVGAEFDLSESELFELRALLDEATFESPEPTGCADCYAYTIESGGETATFDQTSYPPGTEPLIAFLSEIVERETPSGPAREAK
jgi:hypothetical protein